MGRGGEQLVHAVAAPNHEDSVIFAPVPSQDDRSLDPQVRFLL